MTGGRRAAAWVAFALVAAWAAYQLFRMFDAAATGLYFMSVAGRSSAIVTAMTASAFVFAVATGLALYGAWRAMKAGRAGRLALALIIAAALPLLHWQTVAALGRLGG